jgi:hypothetical protein
MEQINQEYIDLALLNQEYNPYFHLHWKGLFNRVVACRTSTRAMLSWKASSSWIEEIA